MPIHAKPVSRQPLGRLRQQNGIHENSAAEDDPFCPRPVSQSVADLGDDVQVGGTDENADELVSNPTLGHIGAVTIRGNMVGSVIGLAYVPGSASRPAAFIQGQSGACGSIFVGGTVQGSYFAGLAFPPQASINGLLITTASNPLFITSL